MPYRSHGADGKPARRHNAIEQFAVGHHGANSPGSAAAASDGSAAVDRDDVVVLQVDGRGRLDDRTGALVPAVTVRQLGKGSQELPRAFENAGEVSAAMFASCTVSSRSSSRRCWRRLRPLNNSPPATSRSTPAINPSRRVTMLTRLSSASPRALSLVVSDAACGIVDADDVADLRSIFLVTGLAI